MTLDQIEWTQGCCGTSCQYAEVRTSTGWAQVFAHPDGTYEVATYDAQMRLYEPKRQVAADDLAALLA